MRLGGAHHAIMQLHVRFQDGTEGIVIFEPDALKNVFEPLRKQDFFNQVHCKDGFVTWAGELDIAPDAMYEQIKSTGKMIIKGISNTQTTATVPRTILRP